METKADLFQKNINKTNVTLSWVSRLFLIVIALILLIPLVWGICFQDSTSRRNYENRNLNEFPEIQGLLHVKQFFTDIDHYLKDHIAFFITINQSYRKGAFYLFKESPIKNVSVSQEEFVFLNSHSTIHHNTVFESLCIPRTSSEKVDAYLTDLKVLDSAVRSFGHRMIFAVGPSKPSIYADKLPKDLDDTIRSNCLRYMQQENILTILERKAGESGVIFHYPQQRFINARNDQSFYPKENFHWNGKSAHLFSKTLFKKLGVEVGSGFEVGGLIVQANADLGMLGFDRPIQVWDYPYQEYQLKRESYGQMFEALRPHYERLVDYSHYSCGAPLQDKHAIILSNSFGTPLAKHLAIGYNSLKQINISHLQEHEKDRFYQKMLYSGEGMDIIFVFHDGAVAHGADLKTLANDFEKLSRKKSKGNKSSHNLISPQGGN